MYSGPTIINHKYDSLPYKLRKLNFMPIILYEGSVDIQYHIQLQFPQVLSLHLSNSFAVDIRNSCEATLLQLIYHIPARCLCHTVQQIFLGVQ